MDSKTEASTTSTLPRRKERKRVTDRLAQRERRKRQKFYVDELEARLRSYKEGPGSEETGALIEENERLRLEVQSLRAFFSSIQSAVYTQAKTLSEADKTIQIPAANPQPPAFENVHISQSTSPQTSESLHDILSPERVVASHLADSDKQNDVSPTLPYSQGSNVTSTVAPGFLGLDVSRADESLQVYSERYDAMENSNWFPVPNDGPAPCFTGTDGQIIGSISSTTSSEDFTRPNTFNDTRSLLLSRRQSVAANIDIFEILAGNELNTSWMGNPQQRAASAFHINPLRDFQVIQTVPRSIPFLPGPEKHRYRLPSYTPPRLIPENSVHDLIAQVRENNLLHGLNVNPPCLADIFNDNPNNFLSMNLKHFLADMKRSSRPSDYLGSYWVLYLLFRWHVEQTPDAYESMPLWLRPTRLQVEIPHPVMIDFIAWPGLRNELVRTSQTDLDSTNEAVMTLAMYVEINIKTDLEAFGDDEAMHKNVCDFRNWKMREGIYKIYPQWQGLCESPTGYD